MKNWALGIVMSIPVAADAQQNEPAVLKAAGIKQVSIYQGNRLVSSQSYNAQGGLTGSVDDSFLAETIRTSRIQRFNERGEVVWVKSTHSSIADTTFWLYTYNDSGKQLSVRNGYSGQEIQRNEYGPTGLLLQASMYSRPDQVEQQEKYTYDGEGRLVESAIDGKFIKNRRSRTTYDTKGREVKQELFDKDKLYFTQLSEYGPSGEKTRIIYLEGGEKKGVRYTYDSKGRLLLRRHFTLVNDREMTTGVEEFTYLPMGLINTYAENIFSFSHTTRKFTYHYQ